MTATSNKSTKTNEKMDAEFLNYCSLSIDEMKKLACGSAKDRAASTVRISTVSKEQILKVEKMSFLEELACILFLGLGVPNGIFTIPPLVYLIGRFLVGNVFLTVVVAAVLVLPLAILPQPFVPSMLQSWLACQVVKYFSFRFVMEERPKALKKGDPNYHPRILVAPPHGVFPYGNILSILVYPSLCGHSFRGLAASSALRPPIFKQILRSIGIIDASRHTARKALERDESLGISTGGVAEVFETNQNDECIVLRERYGLIKLAIRTGADLTPCYLFGNTKILSCWAGEGVPQGRNILERVSRKIGFALIFIHGRFGLPIPRRTPILGVMGKGIPTHHMKCEEPTKEQIHEIQMKLIDEMDGIFERYKGMYGWDDKKLIIK
jgi:1-acyl-sn-glycerol-3-phosphate acyltransferase